jgi:hypothetical protein
MKQEFSLKKHQFKMQQYSKLLSILFFILSISVNAQVVNLVKINPEISKKIIENKNINFNIFTVSFKEVDFPIYEIGEVPSKQYKIELEKLEKLKTHFDDYQNEYNLAKEKYKEINSISTKIIDYLNSKEKYDSKVNYLIEAQKIVSKYDLASEFRTDNIYMPTKIIILYNKNKRTSKSDLEYYKDDYINKIRFKAPEESYKYKEYIWKLDKLNAMSKTESGMVLSTKTKKKQIYIIKDTLSVDYKKISGEFSIVGDQFRAALVDIPNELIKNQIVNSNNYNLNLLTDPYPLIKKNDSDEYFYIMNNEFLSELKKEQNNNELFEIIHKLGYKEYKEEEEIYYNNYFYIKSKTSKIRLDDWTLSELRLNPGYITTLDNDQLRLATLAKQTIPHSKILDRYCSLYNIQRSRMSAIDIKNWRIATANALKLDKEIYKISEKYFGNYSFELLNKSKTMEEFTDNVLASKGVLGM